MSQDTYANFGGKLPLASKKYLSIPIKSLITSRASMLPCTSSNNDLKRASSAHPQRPIKSPSTLSLSHMSTIAPKINVKNTHSSNTPRSIPFFTGSFIQSFRSLDANNKSAEDAGVWKPAQSLTYGAPFRVSKPGSGAKPF